MKKKIKRQGALTLAFFVEGNRKNGLLRFQLSDGLNAAEDIVALKVRVKGPML